MTIVAEAEEYRIPLYTQPQAAQIIDVRPETLRNWARGYAYKTLGGVVEAFPMITTTRSGHGRAPSVPFLGLAEALWSCRGSDLRRGAVGCVSDLLMRFSDQ